MKVTHLLENFTGGELSPRLDGRVKITKYSNGCRRLENFTVLPHGGVRKRSGTKFVVEQKNATDDVILVPFQYNVEQSYMLLFGPGYVWFLKEQGIITFPSVTITGVSKANPGVVTAAGHGYSNGDRLILGGISGMTELNNRQVIVAGATATTFQLTDTNGDNINTSAYTTYTANGTASEIVELTTTYTNDELSTLAFAQSADTLYIAHKNHPLRKITRSSHTSWALEEPTINTGPFRTINPTRANKITPSNFSASATSYGTHIVGETCTLTASSSGTFHEDMVGALFRLNEEGGSTGINSAPIGDSTITLSPGNVYTNEGMIYGVYAVNGTANWGKYTRVPAHDSGTVRVYAGSSSQFFDSDFLHPGYCIVRITAYTSSTVVTAQIVRYQMPRSVVSGGTSYWEEGAWSEYRGYPRAIAFYEQRLFLAGSDSDPSVLWGSRSAAYEDFEDGADDDDALIYRITSGLADTIRWLMSGRVLTAGSSAGEYAIAASSQNEALTPSNFKANPQTSYGTSSTPPIRINQAVLYPQRQGDPDNASRKLREFAYSYESDSFNSTDLTVFSEHIFSDGLTRLAYQVEPDSIVWVARTDGQLAACTYERSQEVIAWHRHVLGGESARVNTLGVIPGAGGDELWLSVTRFLGDPADVGVLVTEDGDFNFVTEDGDRFITEETETVRYIEVMQAPFRDDAEKDDAFFVDSGLTYTGDPTTTISGLWHLREQNVKYLYNGSVGTGTVSATGRLTLTSETTKCHIGLTYTAILETEDLEAGAQAGTAQSRAKRISEVYLRLINSLGAATVVTTPADPNETIRSETLYFRTGEMGHGASPDLFSGLKQVDHPGGWERYARIRVEHADPLPFHIGGLVAEMSTTG
jgi:hypothetical protein